MFQKCKVYQTDWYDMKDIFDLTTEDEICEICCTNKKDSYYEEVKLSEVIDVKSKI